MRRKIKVLQHKTERDLWTGGLVLRRAAFTPPPVKTSHCVNIYSESGQFLFEAYSVGLAEIRRMHISALSLVWCMGVARVFARLENSLPTVLPES
ncbi:hypothetical protein EVAR_69983_1 [Eumeta japonica]|uniref:Uncharacterized protein n=1 Tax=Eumeta variegata TaxID=151549 RepID=A0A4C1ZEB4_EUMVA|nr:hypothetical protein EVAR_69983_1 [Eumeta japonica]